MKYNPDVHNRRSIRLKGYNYAQTGLYFITICTQNRLPLFGNIENGEMFLNDAGQMVKKIWNEIPQFYDCFNIHNFVVMPNHIHGIIQIVGAGPRACPDNTIGQPSDTGQHHVNNGQHSVIKTGQPQGVAPTMTIPDMVHRFKTLTTKRYVDGVKQHGWASFPGKLWQRNYYEHIVRNDDDLKHIQEYIINNPMNWKSDDLNQSNGNCVGAGPRACPGENITCPDNMTGQPFDTGQHHDNTGQHHVNNGQCLVKTTGQPQGVAPTRPMEKKI